MKKENKHISTLIVIGFLLVSFFFNETKPYKFIKFYIDKYSIYYPTLLIALMSWLLLSNLRHRNKENKTLVIITTENDNYYRILPYIFGSLTIIVSLILIYYSIFDFKILIQVTFIGVLLIISGILYEPVNYVQIKKEKLIFNIDNIKKWIKLDKIKSINIQSDKIVVLEKSDRINNIDHLNMTTIDLEKLEDFLKSNIKTNTEIESV
ncbi:hypothetical protein GTQ40_12760 [Flavobacteriaceae bacterium R38]|nr:hypothetical protein [Flavobacteriaceae bacterium R38]